MRSLHAPFSNQLLLLFVALILEQAVEPAVQSSIEMEDKKVSGVGTIEVVLDFDEHLAPLLRHHDVEHPAPCPVFLFVFCFFN